MAEVARFTLDGNADVVEFCSPPSSSLLAAATYTLLESSPSPLPDSPPSRIGSLTLFSLSPNLELHPIHRLPSPAIFDIKWRPHLVASDDFVFLSQASADGTLTLYRLQSQHGSDILLECMTQSVSSSMCLSVDWDPHSRNRIALSHSDGSLSVLEVGESDAELCESNGSAHTFEAWSVTYDSWKPGVLYSGGDDCQFCCWDFRQDFCHPVFKEKKGHQMGVCSIQTNLHEENLVATGSYDEHLRLWDTRMLQKPVVDKFLGLGGGVWKLKWNPFHKAFLAAACMHNGFAIVKVGENNIHPVVEYKNHGSLAYGIDWLKEPYLSNVLGENSSVQTRNVTSLTDDSSIRSHQALLASCSFYDKSLHIWKANLYQ